MRLVALAILLASVGAGRLHAQSGSYQATGPAAAALQLSAPSPMTQPPLVSQNDLLAARRFNSRAPGATLMIIGGAATVAGILVGGSGGFVLILGGVGLGAYGFYLYTR